MNKHQLRVQETLQYFTQKDIGLAFRKLLDCAADTQQMSIYEKAIALSLSEMGTHWLLASIAALYIPWVRITPLLSPVVPLV